VSPLLRKEDVLVDGQLTATALEGLPSSIVRAINVATATSLQTWMARGSSSRNTGSQARGSASAGTFGLTVDFTGMACHVCTDPIIRKTRHSDDNRLRAVVHDRAGCRDCAARNLHRRRTQRVLFHLQPRSHPMGCCGDRLEFPHARWRRAKRGRSDPGPNRSLRAIAGRPAGGRHGVCHGVVVLAGSSLPTYTSVVAVGP
jgi:hypothetical protein